MSNEQHLIFGTGPIGKAVMTELVKRGKTVSMVNRSGKLDAPAGVTIVKGDITDVNFTRSISMGKTHIYNCTNAPYDQWVELFPPLNKNILEGAKASGAKLIVMDNLYCYGDPKGKPLTEDLPYNATGKKGVTRAKMAQELLDAHKKGDVRMVIGRASDFFGKGVMDSASGDVMFGNAVKGKTVQVLGDADALHTYSFVPDIGKGLVILGEHDEAFGKAWHLPNAETLTTRQFVQLIFNELGTPIKLMAAGTMMVRVLGIFMPPMREFVEMMYEFNAPFVVDDSPFKKAFGNHATPLKQAVAETVAWFKQQA